MVQIYIMVYTDAWIMSKKKKGLWKINLTTLDLYNIVMYRCDYYFGLFSVDVFQSAKFCFVVHSSHINMVHGKLANNQTSLDDAFFFLVCIFFQLSSFQVVAILIVFITSFFSTYPFFIILCLPVQWTHAKPFRWISRFISANTSRVDY